MTKAMSNLCISTGAIAVLPVEITTAQEFTLFFQD